jgi:taurine dioxygenase
MNLEVRKVASGFAGEVIGADLSREEDFAPVHQAFLDYGVVAVRGGPLAPAAQIAFAKRFGPLMGRRPSTPDKVLMPGYPEIILLSNRREKGQKIGISDAGRYWHSDLCFEEKPNLSTVVPLWKSPRSAATPCSPIWRWPIPRCLRR